MSERPPTLEELANDVPVRELLDDRRVLAAIVRPDGEILDVSERGLALAGVRREDIVGRRLWDTVWWSHPSTPQTRLEAALESATRGAHVSLSGRFVKLDGNIATLDVRARPIRGGGGDVRFILLETNDIVDAASVRDRLQESQASLLAIFDTATDAIISIDETGRIEALNRAAGEIFGYAAAELIGEKVDVLMPEPVGSEHPSYVARYLGTGEARIIGAGREVVGRRKDGSEVPLELSVGDSRYDGQRRFVGILRDLSERVRAADELRATEARLRRASELAHIGVIDTAAPFGSEDTKWSEEVYRMCGRDPGLGPPSLSDAMGVLVHPDDREEIDRELKSAGATGRTASLEYRVLRGDGRIAHLRARFEAERDEYGDVARWIGAIRDVTQQRALEAELVRAQKMEAVARLTAGIAHEYNNLLMGIRGCTAHALRRIGAEHPAARFVLEAERAAERGAALTRQLIDFSVPREHAHGLVDLDRLVERTHNMLRAALGEQIELSLTLDAPRWRIHGDSAQIEHVLMNLAFNARDAMPEGGVLRLVTSEVSVGPADARGAPGDLVVLTLSDTGSGMDEETVGRAFDPFFTTKRAGEGSGLGLSTVYGIVHACGGDISVQSELGRGTTFTLLFPRATSDGPCPPEETDVAPKAPAPRSGSERILVVEDEPLIRMTLRSYLEPYGYEVVEACDVAEASLYLRRDRRAFDLVVTDVMLPGGTGRHVAEQAHAVDADTPVIFMSAHPIEVLLESERIPPGSTVLQKPFSEEVLLAEIRRVLNGADG